MSETSELWEADAGDVITVPRHWPAQVTVESVEYADAHSNGESYFVWLEWTSRGARGREWYSAETRIGIVSLADRGAADDDALADLRAALEEAATA